MREKRQLSDWLFILLQTVIFTAILIGLTSLTQDMELCWCDWYGLPIVVVVTISLLGVLLLDDYLNR